MTTTRRAEGPSEGTRRSPIATAVRWVTGLALAVAVIGVARALRGHVHRLALRSRPCRPARWSRRSTRARRSSSTPIAVDDVAVGDVIVFAAPTTGRMTVHRVVEIEQGENGPVFTTKGDANDGPDPWRLAVDGDHLHRVRMAVPVLGQILLALSVADHPHRARRRSAPLLVLGFGLTHVWRRPEPDQRRGRDTWDAALDRMVHALPHPHLPHPHLHHHAGGRRPTPRPRRPPMAEAVDAARRRSLDPLVDLLAADHRAGGARHRQADRPAGAASARPAGRHHRPWSSSPSPARRSGRLVPGPHRQRRRSPPPPPARQQPRHPHRAAEDRGRPAPGTRTTALTMAWTNPNATDSAQVLVATTSGGTTTVGATAAGRRHERRLHARRAAHHRPVPLDPGRRRHLDLDRLARDAHQHLPPGRSTPTPATARATFAGDGGAATAASLNVPLQSFEAPDGRVFVADSANNRIRVIVDRRHHLDLRRRHRRGERLHLHRPGRRRCGMNAPRGVAVDAAGNVYIADTGAACIRKVDTAGNVTRFAGGGATTTCNTAVAPTALSLSSPSGLAVDSTGALIVADTGRNCVRRLTATTTAQRRRRRRHDHLRRHHRHRRLALAARSASPSTPRTTCTSPTPAATASARSSAPRSASPPAAGPPPPAPPPRPRPPCRCRPRRASPSTAPAPSTSPTPAGAASARSSAPPSPRSASPAPTAPPATTDRRSAATIRTPSMLSVLSDGDLARLGPGHQRRLEPTPPHRAELTPDPRPDPTPHPTLDPRGPWPDRRPTHGVTGS